MRAVVQRVRGARVEIDGKVAGQIEHGLLVLLGIGKDDTLEDVKWMVDKVVNLRIFEKEKGKMNESLLDVKGGLLVVSQFTLYGDCSKGRRPSFSNAMEASSAKVLFEAFLDISRQKLDRVESGVFQAYMDVILINDGPVTLIIDSKK